MLIEEGNLILDLLSGTDRIGSIYRADEDFPVAMLAGPGAELNSGDGGFQLCLFDHKSEHELRQFAVNPAADLDPALLPAAKHIHLCQRDDAGGLECVDNLFFPVGTNNGSNHSHVWISTHTLLSSTKMG